MLFGKRLAAIEPGPGAALQLRFADDSRSAPLDVLWAPTASTPRCGAALFGEHGGRPAPRFTGLVAFRAVVPTERVRQLPDIGAFTKWWGLAPHSQMSPFR